MKNTKKEYTIIITIAPIQQTPISKIKENIGKKTSIREKKISSYTYKKTPTSPKRKTLGNTFYNKNQYYVVVM
jgi:hypothetical protein